MLSRDFNARTSCKQNSILCDTFVADIDADDYVIDNPLSRYYMDRGNNSHGNKLLDLCKATALRNANGRLGSYFGKGKYTCFNRNGYSVSDNLLLNGQYFNSVNDFKVREFKNSRHLAPLSFNIKCNSCCEIEEPNICDIPKMEYRM